MLPSGFYKGTVKWFDSRSEKRFGFIVTEDGREIFFHFNDGQYVIVDDKTCIIQFSGSGTREREGRIRSLRDPKQGEVLVFKKSAGARGDKAAPWGFYSTWQLQEQWLADNQEEVAKRKEALERQKEAKRQALANRPVYRVLEQMTSTGGKPGEIKVLWQGQDLEEVKRRFPVPSGRMSPSADKLLSYWADSDNIFEVRRWWERQNPDGSWERCEDQRSLSGVLRTFEAINRR